MGRYVLIRIAGIIGVVWAVSLITFILMHSVPGGPYDMMALATNHDLPDAIRASIMHTNGLDKPILQQYIIYMGNAVRLDFGDSWFWSNRTVLQILRDQWPYSLELGLFTAVFAGAIGLVLGIGAAIKEKSWLDFLGTATSLFCLAMPSFVFALMLQLIFAIKFGLVDVGGVVLGFSESETMDLTNNCQLLGTGADLAALYQG